MIFFIIDTSLIVPVTNQVLDMQKSFIEQKENKSVNNMLYQYSVLFSQRLLLENLNNNDKVQRALNLNENARKDIEKKSVMTDHEALYLWQIKKLILNFGDGLVIAATTIFSVNLMNEKLSITFISMILGIIGVGIQFVSLLVGLVSL